MDNRRRIILINKRFQISLIIKFILVNIFILSLFGIFLFFFLNSEIEANLHSAHVTYLNMKGMLFPLIFTLSVLNILISSTIITVFVLYASFRIAGPLYRFNTALREISQGNLKPLMALRDKDELYEFSESLQKMADRLVSYVEKGRAISTQLKETNSQQPNPEVEKSIAELDQLLNGLRT